MMEILEITGLSAVCLVAILLTALRLPGTWLIVAAAAGYGWWTQWDPVGMTVLLILTGIALFGELVELGMSVVTARKVGASGRAAWGGLIGGFVGMIVFSIPVPLIGTVIGALLGCFAGAMIGELSVDRRLGQGAKVGFFAAVGFVLGTVAKLALAMVMTGVLISVIVLDDSPAQRDLEIQSPTSESPVIDVVDIP